MRTPHLCAASSPPGLIRLFNTAIGRDRGEFHFAPHCATAELAPIRRESGSLPGRAQHRRKKLKDVSLPYGLHFGDSPTAIQQTLGCKPFSKSKNYAGEPFWTFYDDNFELMVVFNKAGTLEWFRIWALHESSRKKRELLENIKGQSRNITPDRAEAIEKLKGKMPTRKWTRRMREGDHEFTAKALEESSGLLSSFIDTVAKATKKRNATSIYSALKKAVTGFNKLSKKHGGFIETLERDELVGFLQDAIALSGFVIEAGVDLTQEYRTW